MHNIDVRWNRLQIISYQIQINEINELNKYILEIYYQMIPLIMLKLPELMLNHLGPIDFSKWKAASKLV